jgi:hypothetical protein
MRPFEDRAHDLGLGAAGGDERDPPRGVEARAA